MDILESIKCMKPYWEKTLFPSIMEIYKDSEEVKFLSDHRDLSELKKLKEIRAKDILPHVMNLPLKKYYTEEFLEKNPNLNLQEITEFVIDCYYFEIIQDVINCRSKGNAPDLNFLSDHSDLSDLEKLEDIRAEDIIEDASKVPLKEYYPDLTLQKITQFVIDCYPTKDLIDNSIITAASTALSSKIGSKDESKIGSIQVGENIQVKDESKDGPKDRSGSIFISWVEPTFRFLRSRISIHILLASQAINMSVYVLKNCSESGIFIPTIVLISFGLYLIHTMIMSCIGYKQNKKLKEFEEQVKLQDEIKKQKEQNVTKTQENSQENAKNLEKLQKQIEEQIEQKEKAENLCILLYIMFKALAAGFILLQIIVPQILNEEPSVYGVISFSIELMLIISVSHCSILNLLEMKETAED